MELFQDYRALAITVFTLGAIVYLLLPRRFYKAGCKTLPGPPGLPLIGNLHQIPPKHSWLKFKEWADIYGPIYKFTIGTQNYVVVSTEKIANDLLRERGAFYSSRAPQPFAADLMSHNLRPLFMPYDDVWRRGRKLMHRLTMPQMATSYQPIQSLESKKLLYDLLKTPDKYETHFERYASGLIFRLAYGKVVESGEESYVRDIVAVNHTVERVASPGAYLVDSIPLLMYLPEWLAPFKKEAKVLHERELTLFRSLLYDVKSQMEVDKAPECFSRTFWENLDEFDLTVDQGAYVIGTLFEAGSGTTSAAMMSFCLCMCLHPEWQDRGAKEVTEVCGDSMPEFDDIPQLPLARAIIKEVMRWRPVTAGGIPHHLIKDDVYDGYFIPKGTNICPNQWAIHREPELYPDPESFNPDRWLDPKYPTYKEPLTQYPNLNSYSCFGFGRRICPGMNIAERSLHLLSARMLWGLSLRKKRDNLGNEVEIPLYAYTSGFNTQPETFPFDIVPRTQKRGELIDEAYFESRRKDPLLKDIK